MLYPWILAALGMAPLIVGGIIALRATVELAAVIEAQISADDQP